MEENGIKKCITDIEKKYGWGKCASWTNHQFIILSSDIEKITGKKISESTLKRILGKKKTENEVYEPQMYTKNILAEFFGQTNWDNYCKNICQEKIPASPVRKEKQITKRSPFSAFKNFFTQKKDIAYIYCANSMSRVPYTAIFHYDISKIKDNVLIDFGNGYSIPLPRDKNMITEFYERAGFFDVRLFTKKNFLTNIKVHNLSKGWQGGTTANDTKKIFKPFDDQTIFCEQGRLHVTPVQLQKRGVDINSEYWTEYRCFDDFNIEMDNMSMEMIAKNDPHEGGKAYYDIEVVLSGEHGNIVFRFIAPNAHCYVDLEFSEKNINGRYNELAAFSRDISDWRNIGMKTINKKVHIFFDHLEVFNCSYGNAIGRMKGIALRFYGCGSLKYMRLSNQLGVPVFEDTFK